MSGFKSYSGSGDNTLPILAQPYSCTGNESNLTSCSGGTTGYSSCYSNYANVAVRCYSRFHYNYNIVLL